MFPNVYAVLPTADDKSSASGFDDGGDERSDGHLGRGREIAIPITHQTRHTVLRVAKGHPGPGVVGPVPVVFRRVLHRLLDILHHRVQTEIADS